MSFYDRYQDFKDLDFKQFMAGVGEQQLEEILFKQSLDWQDFLALLSPQAGSYLEPLAQRAREVSIRNFGRVILLYTPLYLANYCVNQCLYCGFKASNELPRHRLSLAEVETEAQKIAEMGIKHLLILTGESRQDSSLEYISSCVEILKEYFPALAVEIYPNSVSEYRSLIEAGVDALTIYQEVYDRQVYEQVHVQGPKQNYRYRLDAPERGCQAGMRSVNIGSLLGLADWRSEAFFTGLHAQYLQNKYPETEISVSVPRLQSALGGFAPNSVVEDRHLVQIILALRLFLPRLGITLSTREAPELRENLISLGITKMSAESSTVVGGYAVNQQGIGQFDTTDQRSVEQIKELIRGQGYQPISKNWQRI
ncbi:2-iminoacetate synthase ThiH [Fuchsiella alkaliacetigena]|uniref:2-iminoacetate synthase ThiH n=1 Tax=Fuchsiella alkaliacetigena TaxID=957042 RepID=UPI00200A2278|nr:2-iminoacetate synthase ThiH [Fuchsiella alkaliacetigena]MCK8825072.1 2-iminoacetate synthase ThiH [Fuchsiella alkaliacetigena]